MIKTIQFKILAILSCVSIILTACEKDDFIEEPTATSVIISGTVTTSSGKPLANLPISVDYILSYNFINQTIIHKAKGTTDSNGRYRLFFEPEPDKSNSDEKPSQSYFLCVDMSGLSSTEYIVPSEIWENWGNVYKYSIYGVLDQGENIDINLFFPKKKELKTELKNFVADKSLLVRNRLRYGADRESFDRNIQLDADGNGNAMIPFALDEVNEVSLHVANNFSDVCSPREITVTPQTDQPIVFDNEAVLDNCRFKLSLYSKFSFNGMDYPDDAAYRDAAPFDFLGFRIVRPDNKYEFPTSRYEYYDSIVWSSPDFPDTFKIYDKKSTETGSSTHLTSQWGSYFFFPGIYKTELSGYRNGRVICSDAVTFELKDRDFLCFDWDKFDYLTDLGITQNIYCQLDGYNEYHVSATIDDAGDKAVDIYLRIKGNWGEDVLLNWQQTRLEYLMYKHLGHWVEYDESTVNKLFRRLPTDDKAGKLYENETTRAIIMHSAATEYDKECYYIHAEPK